MAPAQRSIQNTAITVYGSLKEIKKQLKMRSSKSTFILPHRTPIEYQINLTAKPSNQVEVGIIIWKGTPSELTKVTAHMRNELAAFSAPRVDPLALQRVQEVLKTYPQNRFAIGMESVISHGKTLSPLQEQTLADLEAKIVGGDAAKVTQLRAIVAQNPTNAFLKSVLDQLETGFTLSPKQEAAVAKFTRSIDTTMEARVQTALEKAKSTYLESLLKQIQAGRTLSPKQLEVLEKIENPTPDSGLLSRVNAVKATPFVESLKAQVQSGRPLTTKQLEALEKIEKGTAATPAPTPSYNTPQEAALADLILNANLPAREDALMSGFFTRLRNGDSLDENESKAVRHLFYRYQRRLRGSYPGDFKSIVRTLFP